MSSRKSKVNLPHLVETIMTVSFWSWVLFFGIELVLPTAVIRVFWPHWFLLVFVVALAVELLWISSPARGEVPSGSEAEGRE